MFFHLFSNGFTEWIRDFRYGTLSTTACFTVARHNHFEKAWPWLAEKYGGRFRRMWCHDLPGSAGGLRARDTQLWQIVMTNAGTRQPNCRRCEKRGREGVLARAEAQVF